MQTTHYVTPAERWGAHWAEDGSLILRARLAAEDGTLLVQALEQARRRVRARRRAERKAGATEEAAAAARAFGSPRAPAVEALIEPTQQALEGADGDCGSEPARLVVHVDAAALTADEVGRCELEHGPVISAETARRLGCDAEHVASIEQQGIPQSVGRKRRTVPQRLRQLVEARDQGICRWPGCDRRHHLAAHHRHHWAHGGETSLDNLILLCWQHHRLVHEGGYTIENGNDGELRFRNRHGLLCPTASRPPPGLSPR